MTKYKLLPEEGKKKNADNPDYRVKDPFRTAALIQHCLRHQECILWKLSLRLSKQNHLEPSWNGLSQINPVIVDTASLFKNMQFRIICMKNSLLKHLRPLENAAPFPNLPCPRLVSTQTCLRCLETFWGKWILFPKPDLKTHAKQWYRVDKLHIFLEKSEIHDLQPKERIPLWNDIGW